LYGLYASAPALQQAGLDCQKSGNYLPSWQPSNNFNNIWNEVIVLPEKIKYLLNSPGKDGFAKLGYSFETLQIQIDLIGNSVTPD